ncbi:Crp/Fnr family transcriptional regulator [Cytophagaceae bacterium DM2B3-1]|uniref:Crp/Fnr family transcriptional regulator n=1 Tax=Xanthocytophaga flava TaxID=3048013 RepID=A0ABT7CPP3_9BACT|nr:Crp/Fnr family transcriptional regulator [Xanthocytophaga flavus]MDJ1471281.1 Crp/Fnr family transcriptional regulator [Xanthocytophaga flavus]MDJ1495720.1 Crp/Fnr family transcriptional regulator [Xanthocytophaga flavus]
MSIVLRQHIEEIVAVTDSEFEYTQSLFTHKKLKKHQYLVQEGTLVTHEYFVLNGLLKASYTNEAGKEHIIQFAMENWWVTDYQAYITQRQATLNIDCIEASELLSISFENKKLLCAELHKMEYFFRMKASLGYVAMQQRILSLLNNDARLRYEQLMQQYPTLLQRVPKLLIASYLGVSRETLSRFSAS